MSGPRRLDELPTFEQIRAAAARGLGDVFDELRSDWAPGRGPTARQATEIAKAREAIAEARRHLSAAARR